jgi:hypothetical protein
LRGRCLPRPRESRTRSSGGLQDSCSWGSRPAKVRGKRRRGTTTLFVLHHEVVISAAGDLSEQAKFKCTKARPSPVAAAEKAQSPCLDTEAAGTRPLESLRARGCCSRRRPKKRCPRPAPPRLVQAAKVMRALNGAVVQEGQQGPVEGGRSSDSGYPPLSSLKERTPVDTINLIHS